jgi:hypothetical protein
MFFCPGCSTIQAVVQGPARALQEAVAEDVAQQLLLLDARVSAVQVYIRKPHVALSGVLDSVGELVLLSAVVLSGAGVAAVDLWQTICACVG